MSRNLNAAFCCFLIFSLSFTGCATPLQQTYVGLSKEDDRFERGLDFLPLDAFGDLISKPYQLLFWHRAYGNHQISGETEAAVRDFLNYYGVQDVKVRLNQWAPHKEMARLIRNRNIAWPYKIIFFPSTLIVSILGRPLSGFLISDYYDPGSNTINIYSDSIPIALHEAGHALDFHHQKYKGTYGLVRMVPGVNLFQESIATDEAVTYLKQTEKYDALMQAYRVLYPAYATYVVSYISASIPALIGAITIGHIIGRDKAEALEWQLRDQGKLPWEEAP